MKRYIFLLNKEKMFRLIKKLLCLSHNFQTWFCDTGHLLYFPQMSAFPFHTFVVLLYQFLRNVTQKEYLPFHIHTSSKSSTT